MDTTRRNFLVGGLALITAPAIVRVDAIMPIKVFDKYRLAKEDPILKQIIENTIWTEWFPEEAGYRMRFIPSHEIIRRAEMIGRDWTWSKLGHHSAILTRNYPFREIARRISELEPLFPSVCG